MHFEFEHLGTPTPFELPEGVHLLGGGAEDQVHLEGLPPGLLTLRIEGLRLMVEARQTFTVAGVLVPPEVPRLVLPGEAMGLPGGMSLKRLGPGADAENERQVGTVAVLKHLLQDTEAPLVSRAASLQCVTGADMGRGFAIADTQTVLGRGLEAHVRLRDIAVSRHHASIRQFEGAFLLEDQDSPNGVYLNGQRVKGAQALQEGDVIELGRTVLRFQAPAAEPSLQPETPPTSEPEPEPPAVGEESVPVRARVRWDVALLGLGATLALVGLLAAFVLTG